MSALIDWAERLEQTRLGDALGASLYAFPIIEGIHLIGLSIAVGLLLIADLRLMGVFLKRIPVHTLLSQVRPWVLGGFALIVISGVLLFVSEASTVLIAPTFAFKFLFMALAAANAAYFELVIARKENLQSNPAQLPRNVIAAGAASVGLWSLVIICGRLIPYIPTW